MIAKAEKRKAGRKKAAKAEKPEPMAETKPGKKPSEMTAKELVAAIGNTAESKKASGIEPWMLTKQQSRDYLSLVSKNVPKHLGGQPDPVVMDNAHRSAVRKALSEGRAVPPEVLADYPDLIRSLPPSRRPARTDQIGSSTPQETKPAPKSDPFLDDMPAMQRGRTEKALAANVTNRGRVVSRRDLVNEKVRDGASVVTAKNGERRLTTPDGSYLDEKAIGKTAMDYAEFLSRPTQPAPAPSRLESAADATIAAAEARKAERRKALAEARRKAKKGDRLGASILPDIVDDVVIVAAKAVKAGAKGVAQLKEIVRKHFGGDRPDVLRQAWRLLRDAQGPEGTVDNVRFESAAFDLQQEAERQAANTESADRGKVIAKGEKESARRVQQAADAAVGFERQSADIREGMAKRAGEVALSKATQEFRAKAKAQREAFYAQMQTEQGRRTDLATLARDMLDPADARKVIKGIAEARSERDQVKIIQRVLDLREARADTESRKYLRGVTGKETVKKPPTLATVIARLMGIKPGDPKTARKGALSKTDVNELRTAERDVVQPVWEALRQDKAADTQPLADHIEKTAEETGRTVFSPERISDLRRAAGKTIDKMTPEERRAVADALNHAAWISDNKNTIEVAGKRRDLVELRAKVGEEVQAFSGTKETRDPEYDLLNSTVKALTVDQMDTSRLVTSLAGRDSQAHEVLYVAPVLAESKAELLHGSAQDALEAVMKKHGVGRAAAADMTKPKPVTLASGKEVKLSASDRIYAAGAWSDPQNRPEILKTGLQFESEKGTIDRILRVTEADMNKIAADLTPFEREWLATFKPESNRLYGEANDAHERMTGFRLEERADHFSRSRDLSSTEREVDPQAKQHSAPGWIEDASIFQKRTGSAAPVLIPRNVFAWADQHLRTLSYMAHVAEPILAARRLMADPALRTVMTRAGGEKWVSAMNDRLMAMSESGQPARTTGLEKTIGHAANIVAKNRLAYRLTSVIKQRLGFINAWMESEGGRTGWHILAQALDPKNTYSPALAKELTSSSGYFYRRMKAGGIALATAADRSSVAASTTVGRGYDAFMRAGLRPLELADASINVGIYKAYKAQYAREGLTGQALIDAAVRATELNVRRSQNPTSAADKSGLNLSRNALLRFVTMFSSPANKMRNQYTEAVREFKANPTAETAQRYIRAHVGIIAAAALSSMMSYYLGKGVQKMAALVTGNTDDEREPKTMKDVAVNATSELTDVVGLFPGSGGVVRGLMGGKVNNSGVIDSVVQSIKAVRKAEEDETLRGADKAQKWIQLARNLPLGPDALAEYTGQAIKGAAGPEPAGWSVKAALDRKDEKSAASRAAAYITLRAAKDPKKSTAENMIDASDSLQASILNALNKDVPKDDVATRARNSAKAATIAAKALADAMKKRAGK